MRVLVLPRSLSCMGAGSVLRRRAMSGTYPEAGGVPHAQRVRGQWPRTLCDGRTSGRDDLEGHVGRDLRVQADGDAVRADRLDRAAHLDAPLVDGRAAGSGDRRRDVGRRDGAEEAAGVAGLGDQLDRGALELRLDLTSGVEVGELAGLPSAADGVDLLLPALGPREREATRHEVVAAVAVLDLDDVAGGAEPRHLLGENQLHGVLSPSQRAVEVYGSSAISRAFLMAVATSRWWRGQLPVTRRARILPRSEMYFRSSEVSL